MARARKREVGPICACMARRRQEILNNSHGCLWRPRKDSPRSLDCSANTSPQGGEKPRLSHSSARLNRNGGLERTASCGSRALNSIHSRDLAPGGGWLHGALREGIGMLKHFRHKTFHPVTEPIAWRPAFPSRNCCTCYVVSRAS
jgi:hypothetical protein